MAEQPTKKRITKATVSRQQAIRNEVYVILREEIQKELEFIRRREDSFIERLNAIEANGVPKGVLEEVKKLVSSVQYGQMKQTRAIEGLLGFFNMSKELLHLQTPETISK